MSSQIGELRPINGWDRLASFGHGTPENFNGFHVLVSLLHQRRSTEVNQTLHGVWRSPGLVHYIYIFGGSCPVTDFCQVQTRFASKSCFLLCWQRYCTALEQWASAKLCGVVWGMELLSLLVIFNRRRHLYSEGGHHVGHRPYSIVCFSCVFWFSFAL